MTEVTTITVKERLMRIETKIDMMMKAREEDAECMKELVSCINGLKRRVDLHDLYFKILFGAVTVVYTVGLIVLTRYISIWIGG